MLSPTEIANQSALKAALQADERASALENFAAAALARLLGVTIAVAKSGFQYGGDAGTAGRQGRHLRIECKKYADTTALSDRELLGEIDQALVRDRALESWVLVATRNVPEQLEDELAQKGLTVGLPVIILDWKDQGLAQLASLCAFAPDLVEGHFSVEAGALAAVLGPASRGAVIRLRKELQAWSLGFDTLRTLSHRKLEKIWNSPRESNAALGQNAAGGARTKRIRRQASYDALDAWWNGPAGDDAPAALVGWDGVGKTWAAIDWLITRSDEQPIMLIVPSSAAAAITGASEASIKRFLGDRLYELTDGVRDPEHWLRRLDRLLDRPKDEGPVLTIFFDGLNQEPSVPWLSILKIFQGESFAGRVRLILSTRVHHFRDRLSQLRDLVVPAVPVLVDQYDAAPGGEFEQMLAFENLAPGGLHPELIELARTPRLFDLVVRFRTRLVEAGQVTVHRLLWEYGRDTLGRRAGTSFSEDEWHDWLREIAQLYRDGMREFSVRALGETTRRADLTQREVFARLSDIIDGQFMMPGPSGSLQLKPMVAWHALGAALLSRLDAIAAPTFERIEAELALWLDPVAGLDQRSEILRAAVSILIERGGSSGTPIAGALVTAWLQTQNVSDAHRLELASLAESLVHALLDAIEHSTMRSHASARLWAMNALRAIPRPNETALAEIVARARDWFRIVSRDVSPPDQRFADHEKHRADRFISQVGIDASGPLRVLGIDLEFVDYDDGTLLLAVPSILEGFPLAAAVSAFEVAALSMAVAGRFAAWEGLKWLSFLNESDPEETAAALRALSAAALTQSLEPGVNPALPRRMAALVLLLTGQEADETAAAATDPGLDRPYSYEKDYLPRPGRSLFALERRHADEALKDTKLSLFARVQRTGELWMDPNFQPPAAFIAEIRAAATVIDVEKLSRSSGPTPEDHYFEELVPVLARCAPDLLADLMRRKMRSFARCPPESRYWAAIHATEHLILAGAEEGDAARALRMSTRETADGNELYATSQLLVLELFGAEPSRQIGEIIKANPEHVLVEVTEILGLPTSAEVDALVGQFGSGTPLQKRNLLALLFEHRVECSDAAWNWLVDIASGADKDLHGLAFRALARVDAARFGRHLAASSWSWSASADPLVNHYGTGALIEGATALPFDQVAPRLGPWRLLEAAHRRGANAHEVRLAASIFGVVLGADTLEAPDPGSVLSIDRTEWAEDPFIISVTPIPASNQAEGPFAALRGMMDTESQVRAHRRAVETALQRIREAREAGASLYLTNIDATDFEPVLRFASDFVETWLEGCQDQTNDFKRRVRLSESAYLALTEALLRYDPPRGAVLWRSVKNILRTRYAGRGNVDELIHMPFRVPESAAVEALQDELVGLAACSTDQDLLNLSIAATENKKTAWLAKVIATERASPLAWQRARGTTLEGFLCGNILPVDEAWPDGPIQTEHEDLARRSGRLRYAEACAHHWWRAYLAASDPESAYAAWSLFLRSADRRAWTWISIDVSAANNVGEFDQLKIAHAQLNKGALNRAMEEHEKGYEKTFLNRRLVNGVGPWGTVPR